MYPVPKRIMHRLTMKPNLASLYLLLCQHIVALIAAKESPPIYIPTDVINLDCGSRGYQFNSFDKRNWTGDIDFIYSPIQVGNPSQISSATLSASKLQVPYITAQLSRSNFFYSFHVTTGQKFIRLYFNPATYDQTFDRANSIFSVTAGDFTLLKDFHASLYADAGNMTTFVREFCVNVDTEQSININFIPNKSDNAEAYAFINGIEIVSMPTNLYYGGEAKYVSKEYLYRIDNNTAMEMIYRINVGGKPVLPDKDTGMYRSWDATDIHYLDEMSMRHSSIPSNTSIQLKFTAKTPEYIAPKKVYQTGRSMGNNNTINLSYNLTWNFPVDSGFNYLVRLHFCEFEPFFFNPNDRVFLIYINNILVEEHADIIRWAGDNGIPVYKDYFVPKFQHGSQNAVNLSIALHPYRDGSWSQYFDVLLNGLEIFKLNDTNGNLGEHNLSGYNLKKMHIILGIFGAIFCGGIMFFCTLRFTVFTEQWKAKDTSSSHRMINSTATPGSLLPSYLCRYFSLTEIKAATKNFNATLIIGAGGFGNVYKGCIDGGDTPVAIKRLNPESSQGAREFKTEIEMLSQLRHRHLVSLTGYCADKDEMILVYDYMARGTLRDHLYHTENPPLLWEKRLQICIGTARGLQYLHSGVKGTIIHRDVKSTNILLDDKWVAKVSDFGLSKGTTNMSKTHISTVVKGSFGYLDPEYYRRQRLTDKSDVYSLGVVLFEVLCARPAVIKTEENEQASLAEWAKTCYQNGEIDQIIDPRLRGEIAAECLNKFTEVAISCMHDNGTERPSMTDVVKGLELALDLHQSAKGIINCIGGNGDTETSTGNQTHFPKESIQCISATIFSEIDNPTGR